MEFVKLNSICSLKQWQTIPTKELKGEGYPVYGANGIIGYSDKYNHDTPTIMICCRGATCGSINVSNGRCYINGNAMALDNLSKDFDINFVTYYLKNYDFSNIITGAAQPQITQIGLDKVIIPHIPLQKQLKMVDILSKIDNNLQIKQNQLNYLDNLIKSRFIEMFGQVETRKTLDTLTTKITDGSHNPPKGVEKSDYIMLSSQNVYDSLILDDVRFLSEEDFMKENKRTDIHDGDVLITIVGRVGRTYVVKNNAKYFFQRSVGVIKPIPNILDGIFLSTYVQTEEAINQIDVGAHGSSQRGIYLNDLKKLLIPVVDFGKQKEFASFVEQIDKSKFISYSRYFLCEILTLFSSTIAYSRVVSIF